MKKTTWLLGRPVTRHDYLWVAPWLFAVRAFGFPQAPAPVTEAWVNRYNNLVLRTYDEPVKVVRVVYWEHLPPVSTAPVAAGIRLRFSTVPSASHDVTYYSIERAPAPTGPWTTIKTQIVSAPRAT
jgi:hypothetical protein